jgi:hypothetical protein
MHYDRGGGPRVTNSTITFNTIQITSRDNYHGHLNYNKDAVAGYPHQYHRYNTILNSPQGGFFYEDTGASARYERTVKDNTYTIKARFTNCFAVVANTGAVTTGRNIVNFHTGTDVNGRGIRIGPTATVGVETIKVRSIQNSIEYAEDDAWGLGGAYAIQLEQNMTSNSLTIAEGGHYEVTGAGGGAAFRFNGYGTTSNAVNIRNCTFKTVGTTTYPNPYHMACIRINEPSTQELNVDFLTFTDCTFWTNSLLFSFRNDTGTPLANYDFTGTVKLVRPVLRINDDAYYTSGTPWFLNSRLPNDIITLEDPVYYDSYTQTEVETKEATDARISII